MTPTRITKMDEPDSHWFQNKFKKWMKLQSKQSRTNELDIFKWRSQFTAPLFNHSYYLF